MYFVPDTPVTEPKGLYFHFDRYAQAIADAIYCSDPRAPLTLSVNGAWGTGKTTLLRAVERVLEGDNEVTCIGVTFDAWKYSKSSSLYVALIKKIFERLEQESFLEKIKARLNDPTRKQFQLWRASLSIIAQLAGVEFDPVDYVRESSFRTNADFFDEFEGMLKDIVKEVTRDAILVIFVDDLDRCTPTQAVEVLEAIKLFLETEGCVFVVAMDRTLVQASIRSYYKDIAVPDFEKQYLDKLIHINFDIPPVGTEEIRQFILAVFQTDDEVWKNVSQLCAIALGGNPRRIIRFVNQFRLVWNIVKDARYQGSDGRERSFDQRAQIEWLLLREASPTLIADFRLRYLAQEKTELMFDLIRAGRTDDESVISATIKRHALSIHLNDPCWNLFQHGDFSFSEDLADYMTLGQRFSPTTSLVQPLDSQEPQLADAYASFAQHFTELRTAKSLSRNEIANMLGLTETVVVLWERGLKQPRRQTVIKLAAAMGLEETDTQSLLHSLSKVE